MPNGKDIGGNTTKSRGYTGEWSKLEGVEGIESVLRCIQGIYSSEYVCNPTDACAVVGLP